MSQFPNQKEERCFNKDLPKQLTIRYSWLDVEHQPNDKVLLEMDTFMSKWIILMGLMLPQLK